MVSRSHTYTHSEWKYTMCCRTRPFLPLFLDRSFFVRPPRWFRVATTATATTTTLWNEMKNINGWHSTVRSSSVAGCVSSWWWGTFSLLPPFRLPPHPSRSLLLNGVQSSFALVIVTCVYAGGDSFSGKVFHSNVIAFLFCILPSYTRSAFSFTIRLLKIL